MAPEQSIICPICKKQKAADAPVGSITSFMFQDMRCTCDANSEAMEARPVPELDRCEHCGRILVERAGSFTSFLFQDLCCRCPEIGQAESFAPSPREERDEDLLLTRFQRTDATSKSSLFGSTRNWQRFDSEAMGELQEQKIIGGYRLIKQIGRGGMGIVFLAEYLALNRICALKFLAPSLVSDKSWVMFQNEAKIVAGLNHPTICQIYDMGVHDGRLPFYAMEYLSGESLESVLLKHRTISVGAAAEVFRKVAEGLFYAHRHGVVHKDIKPANIMLTPVADGQVEIKILDFGIAELVDNQVQSKADPKDVIGSAFYMSPEQLRGEQLDQRSDIYNIGCTLFEALTGEPPFTGITKAMLIEQHNNEPVPSLNERTGVEFPPEVEDIIQKALEKLPEDRYQNAEHLAEDLALLLASKPIRHASMEPLYLGEKEIPWTPPPQTTAMAGHWGVLLVLVATAICLGVGYLSVMFFVHSTSPLEEDIPKGKTKNATEQTKSGDSVGSDDKPFVYLDTSDKYETAVAKTASRVESGTSDAKAAIAAGMGLSEVEEAEPAIRNLKKGIALDPSMWSPRVSDALVKSYVDLAQFENALDEVNKGLAREVGYERYRTKGQVLCQLNRNSEAIECFNKAIQQSSNEYWVYYDRGCCYALMNENEKALKDFSKLISMRPDEARGYALRSKCYTKLGKPDLAAQDLERAKSVGHIEMGP